MIRVHATEFPNLQNFFLWEDTEPFFSAVRFWTLFDVFGARFFAYKATWMTSLIYIGLHSQQIDVRRPVEIIAIGISESELNYIEGRSNNSGWRCSALRKCHLNRCLREHCYRTWDFHEWTTNWEMLQADSKSLPQLCKITTMSRLGRHRRHQVRTKPNH